MDMASLAEGVSVSSSKRTDRLFFCSDKNRSKVESTNGAFTFERRLWSKARSFSVNVFVDDTAQQVKGEEIEKQKKKFLVRYHQDKVSGAIAESSCRKETWFMLYVVVS